MSTDYRFIAIFVLALTALVLTIALIGMTV
jgi:hypothetical protein